MIRPTLTRYRMGAVPEPVPLDTSSLLPDSILLLDSFFHVVLWHGEHVKAWRDAGYHLQPQYAALKAILEKASEDALELMRDRFPVPHYVVTEQGGSQARFLVAKLNPSTTHVSTGQMVQTGSEPAVFTDDVSLQVFMEHLKKLAVSNNNNAVLSGAT